MHVEKSLCFRRRPCHDAIIYDPLDRPHPVVPESRVVTEILS